MLQLPGQDGPALATIPRIRPIPRFPSPVGIFPRSIPKATVAVPGGLQTGTPNAGAGAGSPSPNPFADLWNQADARVRGMVDPLLLELARQQAAEEAKARAAADYWRAGIPQAIEAHRPGIKAAYEGAVSTGQKLEDAVANRLNAAGAARAAAHKAELERQGAPVTDSSGLEASYKGASGAGYASGVADLSVLNTRGAEALNWLEQQGLLSQRQADKQFGDLLSDIFTRYDTRRGEITAELPGQIDEMFQNLKNEQDAKNKAALDALEAQRDREFDAWKVRQDNLIRMKAIAVQMGEKKAAREFDAMMKREEREWRSREADLNRQVTQRGQDISAETARTTDNPPTRSTKIITRGKQQVLVDAQTGEDIRVLGPAPSGAGGGGETAAGLRQREKDANRYITASIYNTSAGKRVVRQNISGNIGAAMTAINAGLRRAGIAPNSPEGVRIRKGFLQGLGIKYGPNGNPYYPTQKPPRSGV